MIRNEIIRKLPSLGYKVEDGIVYKNDQKISLHKHRGGYYMFKALKKNIGVHRFVAYMKYGEKTFEPGIQVRHLDNDSFNNIHDNIAIGTASENAMDKSKEMRMKCALTATSFVRKHNHLAVLEDHKKGVSYTQLMKKYNISSKGTISWIINHSMVR